MNRNQSEGLDQVLASYAEASEQFDARVLHDYIQRYPKFADALNRYAQVQLSSVRATADDVATTDLSDDELLPMQSKLLQQLQQLRGSLGAGEGDGKDAAKKLAAIKGAKATEAAARAVFGGIGDGEDDLLLLVTEPTPGISDVPDWVYSELGGHLGVSSAGMRAHELDVGAMAGREKRMVRARNTWKTRFKRHHPSGRRNTRNALIGKWLPLCVYIGPPRKRNGSGPARWRGAKAAREQPAREPRPEIFQVQNGTPRQDFVNRNLFGTYAGRDC